MDATFNHDWFQHQTPTDAQKDTLAKIAAIFDSVSAYLLPLAKGIGNVVLDVVTHQTIDKVIADAAKAIAEILSTGPDSAVAYRQLRLVRHTAHDLLKSHAENKANPTTPAAEEYHSFLSTLLRGKLWEAHKAAIGSVMVPVAKK